MSQADRAAAVPQWWQSRVEQVHEVMERRLTRGRVVELKRSSGGRPVHAVSYGEPEPGLRGRANFNSAMGAGQPGAYVRREARERPVLMIIAGTHGHETEGVVGALSLLHVLDHGTDITGAPQPALANLLRQLRVVAVPLANPDGRARVPYAGLVGVAGHEMHRVGQGTRPDGSNWPRPHRLRRHPPRPPRAVHARRGVAGDPSGRIRPIGLAATVAFPSRRVYSMSSAAELVMQ